VFVVARSSFVYPSLLTVPQRQPNAQCHTRINLIFFLLKPQDRFAAICTLARIISCARRVVYMLHGRNKISRNAIDGTFHFWSAKTVPQTNIICYQSVNLSPQYRGEHFQISPNPSTSPPLPFFTSMWCQHF